MRRTGARVVHAHNVQPSFGWRALAAARSAGARVVLHLHNYRLVCAVGVCFTHGADCTRCHGRNTLPGVRLNCRGGSRAESARTPRARALAAPARGAADAFVVPSVFALGRLRTLGAPLGDRARVVASVQRRFAALAGGGRRLRPVRRAAGAGEGRADAVVACKLAGLPLVVAGEGPQAAELMRSPRAPTCASPAGSSRRR